MENSDICCIDILTDNDHFDDIMHNLFIMEKAIRLNIFRKHFLKDAKNRFRARSEDFLGISQ